MPLYEYRCSACGRLTEALQRLGEPPLSECPHCGGSLERVVSAPALQFKGAGWYVTDYGRGAGNAAKDKDGGTAKTADAKAADKATASDKTTKAS